MIGQSEARGRPPRRQTVPNAAPWGKGMLYSRAVRVGDTIEVSGTTAVDDAGEIIAVGDVAGQVKACLHIIDDALQGLGSGLTDVVRTRVFVTDATTWREAGQAHDEVFGTIAPASSLVGVAALLHPDLLVEIEATAVAGSASNEIQPRAADRRAALLHTSLTVASLAESIAFYRDVLGMELLYEQEKRGGYLADIVGLPDAHVRMAQLRFPASDHRLELFEYVGVADQAAPRRPWDRGISHICLGVPDIDTVIRQVRAAGLNVSDAVLVDTGANRGGRSLYFRDPDGITIELFQAPGGDS